MLGGGGAFIRQRYLSERVSIRSFTEFQLPKKSLHAARVSVTVTVFLCFPLFQLLRESEANSMRLTEQAKVLKDEIRR